MSAEVPPKLDSKVANQAGIITRKQAIGAGMSSRAIEWKITAGRWQQVYRGVYATFTGSLPRQATLWATRPAVPGPALAGRAWSSRRCSDPRPRSRRTS